MEIDIYSIFGPLKCSKFGKRIKAKINDISLSVDFLFDLDSNIAIFNINTNFGEYIINNYFYETKEMKQTRTIGNIIIPLPSRCKEIGIGIPEGEKKEAIINAKKIETNMIYNF